MVETVGSDQKGSLDKDLLALEAQIKAAKKIDKDAPAVSSAEGSHTKLKKLVDKIEVGKTVVAKYTAVRTDLTTTMKAELKNLKAVKPPEATGPVDIGISRCSVPGCSVSGLR